MTYFTIQNKLAGNVIDITQNSTVPGADLDAYTPKTSENANQLWEFIPDPQALATILSNAQWPVMLSTSNRTPHNLERFSMRIRRRRARTTTNFGRSTRILQAPATTLSKANCRGMLSTSNRTPQNLERFSCVPAEGERLRQSVVEGSGRSFPSACLVKHILGALGHRRAKC